MQQSGDSEMDQIEYEIRSFIRFIDERSEKVIKLAFVTDFPDHISSGPTADARY